MPFPDSQYPSVLRGYDKRQSQRLLAAAPEMLAALRAASQFIDGHNDEIDMNQVWLDYCFRLQSQLSSALSRAEGRD